MGEFDLEWVPLINTKFFVPRLSHLLFVRSRLLPLLNGSLQRQVTLVSAPAGYGKTTLVAAWLKSLPQDNPRIAWLSLEPGDNDPRRFWMYVLTALDKSSPAGIATQALSTLRAEQVPPFETVLASLINALASQTTPIVLILDDYQVISHPEVHGSLIFLLEHLPPQLHLILLTRTDPPLRLSRLRARDQLLEIRTDQLRCTTEEAAAFLAQVMRLSLPAAILQEVIARAEGWLVGLQLIGLSLRGHPDPEDMLNELSGSHHYILDYLTDEVLRQQPQSLQEFLLHTSILSRLSAPLCEAVTGQPVSQEMLEELERANLFVVPLDEQRHWYRYHPLFAEALGYRLEYEEKTLIPTLHLRASQWYQQQGVTEEAFQHAVLAQAWDRAADIIEAVVQIPGWTGRESVATMHHWLRELPAETVRSRPYLCLTYARILFLAGELKAAESWLQAAETVLRATRPSQPGQAASPTLLEEHEREHLLGEIAARRALTASYYGDDQAALDLSREALEHLTAEQFYDRALIAGAQGFVHLSHGEAVAATQSIIEASDLFKTAGYLTAAISQISIAAQFLHMQGQLHQAWQMCQDAIALGTGPGGPTLAAVGVAYAYQADVLREWNQMDQALDLVLEGIRLGEQGGYVLYLQEGYLALARLHMARGELDAAAEVLQRLAQNPLQLDNATYRLWTMCGDQVRLWLARGEVERAVHWAQEAEQEGRPNSAFARERQDTARVRVLLAQARPEQALRLLEPLIPSATRTKRWGHVIEMRLLQALAYQMHGDGVNALTSLGEAVRLAEPEGYIRMFADEGTPMADLLVRLKSMMPVSIPYLDTVLAAFESDMATHARQPVAPRQYRLRQSLLDPLTHRETEVLLWMAQGASNQEIAQNLVISLDTVKRHVSNILSKLNAKNRTHAVARARSLGLLEEE